MVVDLKDVSVIMINLEEIFGKVVHLSELDATKIRTPEHPDRMLTLTPEEKPVFLTYVDEVVIAATPKLMTRLTGEGITRFTPHSLQDTLWEDFKVSMDVSDFDDPPSTEEDMLLVAIIGKGALSKEGLELVNYAITRALTEGVLSMWQEGVEQYAMQQHLHEMNYQAALKLLSDAATYRTALKNRIKVPQRF